MFSYIKYIIFALIYFFRSDQAGLSKVDSHRCSVKFARHLGAIIPNFIKIFFIFYLLKICFLFLCFRFLL